MTLQYNDSLRANQLLAIISETGDNPRIWIYSGATPANCNASHTGTFLAEFLLPASPFAQPNQTQITRNGTWAGVGYDNGTAGYFRLINNAGNEVIMQGTITATGGGGQMTMDDPTIATDQAIIINTFTITAGNG